MLHTMPCKRLNEPVMTEVTRMDMERKPTRCNILEQYCMGIY